MNNGKRRATEDESASKTNPDVGTHPEVDDEKTRRVKYTQEMFKEFTRIMMGGKPYSQEGTPEQGDKVPAPHSNDNQSSNSIGEPSFVDGAWQCPYPGCHAMLEEAKNIPRHLKLHLPYDERPYPCLLCDARYLDNTDLKTHIRVAHEKVPAGNCSKCGKAMAYRSGLKRHEDTCRVKKPS
jgi:uncharacterized Zn-finger protein